jgi:hypothetical protein
MEQKTSVVYSQAVVEFVTVAVQYCIFLEQGTGRERHEFVDTMLKMLPLLYLKALLLPPLEDDQDYVVEQQVQEEDYEFVRSVVAGIMGGQDDYLDVFVEDMKYSDTPIRKNISEDLADIYQDVRNFVGVYKQGMEESMYEALAVVHDNFELFWGQTLVNTLRALHEVHFNQSNESLDTDETL